MDKKELKKLLEEKKLADTLMKDESFRKEAEEILKSEGVEFNSKDLESTLKGIEKVLSGEVKIENDDDLDEVVGGITAKGFARGAIKTVWSGVGAYVGSAIGWQSGLKINGVIPEDMKGLPTGIIGAGAGAVGGGAAGYKLGYYICEALGLND